MTRTLGTTAPLTVSVLGLGCMEMSEFNAATDAAAGDRYGDISSIDR